MYLVFLLVLYLVLIVLYRIVSYTPPLGGYDTKQQHEEHEERLQGS